VDTLAIHTMVVRNHFNAAHRPELRDCAAQLTRLPVGLIASATLTDVTIESVTLNWIDIGGAHRVRLGFTRPASDRAELDWLLHECLANIGSTPPDHTPSNCPARG